MASCFREQCLLLWTLLSWKCGYNPLKQGYTPYGPYLVIIPVTLPNFNWQGGANSASHFTLPRTQPCFPRPLVFFCLGDGISLTASAFRGIRRNAPQRNEILRHSDATKAMRSPQRRARGRATKFLGMCDEGNAQPAAAYAPHSNEIH